MRVVAGSLGGRKLQGPGRDLESQVRPTTDRVRESVFNSLASLDALDGASVVDLFSGTGACGIEALSRGAGTVTFVDSSRRVCDLIRSNLATLDIEGRVVCSDVTAFARSRERFDIAIVDPPYGWQDWANLLGTLNARLVVCEESRAVTPPDGWTTLRSRRYGQTVVTVLEEVAS